MIGKKVSLNTMPSKFLSVIIMVQSFLVHNSGDNYFSFLITIHSVVVFLITPFYSIKPFFANLR